METAKDFFLFNDLRQKYNLLPFQILPFLKKIPIYKITGHILTCPVKFNQKFIDNMKKFENLISHFNSTCDTVNMLIWANPVKGFPAFIFFMTHQERCDMLNSIQKVKGNLRKITISEGSEFCNLDKLYSGKVLNFLSQEKFFHDAYPILKKSPSITDDIYDLPDTSSRKKLFNITMDYKSKFLKEFHEIAEEIATTDWNSWENFEIPETEEMTEQLIDQLHDKYFKVKDLKPLINSESEKSTKNQTQNNSINEKALNKKVDELLKVICLEANEFYTMLSDEVENTSEIKDSITEISKTDLHHLALQCLKDNHKNFKHINPKYLDSNIFTRVEKRHAKIVGTIARNFLRDNLQPEEYDMIKRDIYKFNTKCNSTLDTINL